MMIIGERIEVKEFIFIKVNDILMVKVLMLVVIVSVIIIFNLVGLK